MKRALTYYTDEKLAIFEDDSGVRIEMGEDDPNDSYTSVLVMDLTLADFDQLIAEMTAFAQYVHAKTGQS